MKSIFILSTLLIFNTGSLFSQKEFGKLIIDKNYKNEFENPPIQGTEGSSISRIYHGDSVVVDSIKWEYEEFIINAYIRDLNHNHPSFDTCNSFFSGDTLIIEFKLRISLPHKLMLKVINDKYYAYFIKGEENKEYHATPKSLIFRDRINKKGQKILGEMAIEFQDPETNALHSFKGPFMCIVE